MKMEIKVDVVSATVLTQVYNPSNSAALRLVRFLLRFKRVWSVLRRSDLVIR